MPTPQQAADDLALLGRRLKTADKQLRKDLLKRLRDEGKPTIEDIRAGLPPSLPNRGGLASRMMSTKVGVRNRLTGKDAGIRLVTTSPKNRLRTLKSMNETGTWRHPLFGDRKRWFEQTYEPAKGWFDEPIENDLPRFRKEIERAMEETARAILRGIGN